MSQWPSFAETPFVPGAAGRPLGSTADEMEVRTATLGQAQIYESSFRGGKSFRSQNALRFRANPPAMRCFRRGPRGLVFGAASGRDIFLE